MFALVLSVAAMNFQLPVRSQWMMVCLNQRVLATYRYESRIKVDNLLYHRF